MEVARTSMIHAAAPHFLWPFAVRYAAHQLNLWPRVSLPKTSPTLRWTGEVGDASVFWFKHLTSRHVFPFLDVTFDESVPFYRLFPYRSAPPPPPPLFLAPGPPLVDPLAPQGPSPSGVSQVDPLPGPAPVQVVVDSGAARGAASGGTVSGGAEPGGVESEGAETGGAEPGGVEPGGAEPGGVASGGGEPKGAEPEGVEPGGAPSEGAECGGAEPQGAASSGGSAGASPSLSPQQLREWFVRHTRLWRGASGAGGAGPTGAGGTGVDGGVGVTGGTAIKGPGAVGTGGVEGAGAGDLTGSGTTGAGGAGAGVGGSGASGAGVGGPGVGGAGAGGAGPVDPCSTVRPRPYFVPLLQQVLGTPPTAALTPPLLCPSPDQSQPPLQPASPLPAPSPYTEQSSGLAERREPASRPVSLVRTTRRVPRLRPPPVPGTHAMTLRPSSVLLRVPLPAPPDSSLPEVPDPNSDRARAASPTVSRLLATAAASALVAELLDFAAAYRLDYAIALVSESASASPSSIGGECALCTDVLEDRQEDFECLAAAVPRFASMLLAPEGDPDAPDILTPRSYAEAIMGPYSSQWEASMDAKMASWKSTSSYVHEVPPPGANIVDGMWIFRVKRPPGSPPAFKARYVARGFSQQQGVDYFKTFSPTPKMTTLRVLLHVAAQRDYELHSLDFNTAFLQGSLHEEIWLRRPPGFTESFPAGTKWSLRWPVYGLCQASGTTHRGLHLRLLGLRLLLLTRRCFYAPTPRCRLSTSLSTRDIPALTWVLQRFGLQFSSPQPTPLSTSHSLSAPPLNESVEPSGPYPELVGCLMYPMTCTRPDLAYPLSLLARYVAPGTHRNVHWDAVKRVLRYLCSTSGMGLVLGGRGPVVLTGHADASWVDDSATQRSSLGYTFSLGSGSVSWRSTRSSLVLSSSCEAEIYAGAMAAQELRWLTYLLTDLGEQPRFPSVLYIDNKAMIALYQEHRLEHRTKHITLRYFLAQELQQRGQLRHAYVATRANIADIFTKALPPACFAFLDWSCDRLFSSTLPMGGGDPTAANTATSRRLPRLETPPGFLPWTSSPPLQPVAADFVSKCYDAYLSRCLALPIAPPCQPRAALPCLSRLPAGRALTCPARRAALLVAHRPPLPNTSPCWPPRRPALPTRGPAGRRVALPCPRAALLAAMLPCPARAPPCWPPRRPALPARSPNGRRASLPCPHTALLAVAPPCPARLCGPPPCPAHFPSARAPPCPSRRPCLRAALLVARHPAVPAMASLRVLTCDHEGRPIQFDTWLDDLQLYLQSDSRDSVSLFDHTSGASLAHPDTADSATRSQWLTRDSAARLAVRNHLSRYSSPAIAALDRLILPYLFPELSVFATVEDLITHLRTSDTRYRAALKAEFLDKNPPLLYINLSTADSPALMTLGAQSLVTRLSAPAGQSCLGIEAAALGASESALPGTAPTEALHTFTLDSGASRFLARSSTIVPCPVVPYGSLSGLHLPSFSTNLVSTAALQDAMVTTTTPGGQRVSICTCTRMGRHLATLTRRPGSILYTLTTETAQDRERYTLLVVDDYTLYTTVFLLRSKGEVPDVLIPWIRAVRLQLRERFCKDLPVYPLHSNRGGEFSSDLLWDFCRGEGILHSFTLPASPQQNEIAKHRIGLVMEVARTSMIHAVAPHFLSPFAVRYAAHQLNLWPRVSLPETSPTLRWRCVGVPVLPPHLAPCPALSGRHVRRVDPLPLAEPIEVTVDSGAAGGGAARGAAFGGAEPVGAEPGDVEP
ncbi:unnamed protein product [Closterium sp. NIES-53]